MNALKNGYELTVSVSLLVSMIVASIFVARAFRVPRKSGDPIGPPVDELI